MLELYFKSLEIHTFVFCCNFTLKYQENKIGELNEYDCMTEAYVCVVTYRPQPPSDS